MSGGSSGASSCWTRRRRSSSPTASTPSRSRPSPARRGITRPIVYGHFEDLGGLLEALVERESRRALEQLPDTFDDLLGALTAYLEAVRTDPDTWRLVLMPQEGAPRLLHERIAAGRAAVVARLAQALDPGDLPDPELRRTCSPPTPTRPPGSCSAATTSSRSFELTRWALARLSRELSRGAVDHRGLLAEREAQVGPSARARAEDARSGSRRRPRGGAARARTRSRRCPTSALAKYVPCGLSDAAARPASSPAQGGRAWSPARPRTPRTSRRRAAARRRPRAGTASRRRRSGTAWRRARAATSGAGPVAQPTFQPVTLNVLPSEEIVSVRSAIPGSVASGMCSSPSKTRCS